ncbi:response regulator [Paenibacillus sp. S150]|uniref:response regulator transcription factor n=1 Tax=Paenibacillus sp. S150 TaxID=2749826 RepID=UPI001C57EE8B|nr:response regulator [Paenibacillus sp. S150]MBW4082542.1 response regulator [Paenibacillus sp. S150]
MYKLVLADDDAEIRSGLSQYFPWAQLGFELVKTFRNGAEAWNYLQEHEADALLCDISMPVMGGLELARRLYEQESGITVVLLSGYAEFDYAREALAYDVKRYLVKPTGYEELCSEFSRLRLELDRSREKQTAGRAEALPAYSQQVTDILKAYVQKHYRTASLEEASRLVHMNPDYVSKFFKQHTGENFSDYVVRVRMIRAAELLRDIRYKTFEISEMVGYSYSKNFTRSFRKFYGMSPREYRNGQQPGDPVR